MSTKEIIKVSSSRNIDAYRSTQPQIIDGEWVVITAYSRSQDDQGGYAHSMQVRLATEDEQKSGQIALLEAKLSLLSRMGLDDDRDRTARLAEIAALADRIRALKGLPSLAEEEAKKQKAEVAAPKISEYDQRAIAGAIEDMATAPATRDWSKICYVLGGGYLGVRIAPAKTKAMSDAEIIALLKGEQAPATAPSPVAETPAVVEVQLSAVKFALTGQPSRSKGWARYSVSQAGRKVIASTTGNEWVSSAKEGQVAAGSSIVIHLQAMLRHGKGRTAREEIYRESVTLMVEEGATAVVSTTGITVEVIGAKTV